jgi:hypothetical protein
LNYFALHSNRVITREELLTNIWPNIIVSDEVITRAIFTLRNALGDNAKNSQYIETIPKKGYVFKVEPTFELSKNNKVLYLIVIIAFLMLITFIVFIKNITSRSIEVNEISPFTNDAGVEYEISANILETDITYIHQNGSNYQLAIKNIKSQETHILIEDDWSKTSPKWLDNNTILFNRCKISRCQLIKYNLNGSQEVIYSSDYQLSQFEIVRSSHPQVIFSEIKNGNPYELKSLDLATSSISPLRNKIKALPKVSTFPIYDNNTDTLFVVGFETLKPTIYAFNFTSGEKLLNHNQFNRINTIATGINDNELVVSGSADNKSGIWLLNTDDLSLDLLLRTAGAETIQEAIALKKTAAIYYSIQSIDTDIIQLSNDKGIDYLTKLNSEALDINASFAPNSKDIYFVSTRSGYRELWFYNGKTEKTRQITHVEASLMLPPLLSQDNRFIALTYQSQTLNLVIIEMSSGIISSRLELNDFVFPLAWSHDNKYIYASELWNDNNLIKFNMSTLEPEHVRKNSGLIAIDSADDNSLITFDYALNKFIKITDNSIIPLTKVIPNAKSVAPGQVVMKEASVIIAERNDSKLSVYEYPFKSAKDATLQKLNFDDNHSWVFAMDPLNQKILAAKDKKFNSKIMFMKLSF